MYSNLRFETRADNASREWRYDSLNRLIDIYGFAGEHTHYDRDLAGNVYQLIDSKNVLYGFGYDLLNREISATYPPDASGATRTETWHYDAAGNLDLYKNAAGQYRHLFYDDRNRLYEAWWDNYAAPEVVIDYDAANRVASIVTNNAQVTAETIVSFGYDAANRKIWENQTLAGYPTRHIETPREPDGNRARLWVTTNGQLNYGLIFEYNQRNQLWHINGGDNSRVTDFTYDANGNLTYRLNYWQLFSGDAFAYDELNRMTGLTNGDANVWFAHSHYQYDNAGREVARWRDEDAGKGDRFWFNSANQLTRAVYQADNVWTAGPSNWNRFRDYNYAGDLLSWTSVNDNGYVAPVQHSNLNQYTSVNNVPIGFDGNFNQTTSYYGHSFVYNAQSQLVGGSMQATYDGLGRCVRRTLSRNTLLFTYDGWSPILEWDGSGNWRGWTIYGAKADEVLLRYDATYGPLVYKHDNQGSVTFLLQGNNQIVEKYTYDVYGRPTVTSWDYNTNSWKAPSDRSSFGNRFMFTGREWLADVQLYDYRNRLYNPDTGTFLQKDPLGFGGGDANFFRYCGGDPVDWSDPFGLWTGQIGLSVSGQFGVFVGSFSAGIAFDGQGNIGFYYSPFAGGGAGVNGSGGIAIAGSNADTIFGLQKDFTEVGLNGGDVIDGSVNAFYGKDVTNGKPVTGLGITIGAGAGLGGYGGTSWTTIQPIFTPSLDRNGNPFPPPGTDRITGIYPDGTVVDMGPQINVVSTPISTPSLGSFHVDPGTFFRPGFGSGFNPGSLGGASAAAVQQALWIRYLEFQEEGLKRQKELIQCHGNCAEERFAIPQVLWMC